VLQDGVAWAITLVLGLAFVLGLGRGDGSEGAFVHRQVRLDVAMGGATVTVTESIPDDTGG
jgi:hypothetical protein